MNSIENRNYYVYRHRKSTNGDVFYIGRGTHKKRAIKHSNLYDRAYDYNKRSKLWKNYYNKYGRIIEIIADNLTYSESNDLEILLISEYGRLNIDAGPLVNLTDGGEGCLNYKPSKELIAKLKARAVPFEEKLGKSINIEGDCWIWTGLLSNDGSPSMCLGSQTYRARRLIFSKLSHPITRKYQVSNTCGDILCVNPEHQELQPVASGPRKLSKLNEILVKEIKLKLISGKTHQSIADEYNVRRLDITKIATGARWAWVSVDGVPDVIKTKYHSKVKKPILWVEKNEIFESAKEASIAAFGDDSNLRYIRKTCNSGRTYVKGFNFRFA